VPLSSGFLLREAQSIDPTAEEHSSIELKKPTYISVKDASRDELRGDSREIHNNSRTPQRLSLPVFSLRAALSIRPSEGCLQGLESYAVHEIPVRPAQEMGEIGGIPLFVQRRPFGGSGRDIRPPE